MTRIDYRIATESMSHATLGDDPLLDAEADVPQHVVYRDFVNETVVLNLRTGTYHGLNPSAGRMLKAIDQTPGTLRDALQQLVSENNWDMGEVTGDFIAICEKLMERGLLETPPA